MTLKSRDVDFSMSFLSTRIYIYIYIVPHCVRSYVMTSVTIFPYIDLDKALVLYV